MAPETFVGEPADVAARLLDELRAAAAQAVEARGRFCLAVPGGSVARLVFPRLAAARLDTSAWHVFWTDERCVPPDDPESNLGLARRLWLEPAGVAPENVHPMPASGADLAEAARAYERTLREALDPSARLDVAVLGVGEDGHVASLFPGRPELEERDRLVVPVLDAPKPPPRRLSLTLRVLFRARLVAVAAFGAGKAHAVDRALHDPASRLPVALVARSAPRCVFHLDAESAAATRA